MEACWRAKASARLYADHQPDQAHGDQFFEERAPQSAGRRSVMLHERGNPSAPKSWQNLTSRTAPARKGLSWRRRDAVAADRADEERRVDPVVVTATRTEEARVRSSGRDRQRRCDTDPAGPAADQPVRVAVARARAGRSEPLELCAGPADFVTRLRRAGELRRPRHTPLPGRHPGDDARRAGADRKLQPRFRAAHRGPARPVLDALWQCRRAA